MERDAARNPFKSCGASEAPEIAIATAGSPSRCLRRTAAWQRCARVCCVLRPNSRAGPRAMVLLVALFLCERAQALVRATSILDPDYHLDPCSSKYVAKVLNWPTDGSAGGRTSGEREQHDLRSTPAGAQRQCTHGRGALLAPRRQAPGERHLHDRGARITAWSSARPRARTAVRGLASAILRRRELNGMCRTLSFLHT